MSVYHTETNICSILGLLIGDLVGEKPGSLSEGILDQIRTCPKYFCLKDLSSKNNVVTYIIYSPPKINIAPKIVIGRQLVSFGSALFMQKTSGCLRKFNIKKIEISTTTTTQAAGLYLRGPRHLAS